ncbi:uncharacterized protein LOC142340621 isoform X1 [Convolutriloba macropyga]|uniref:uncharacterized protein LOC142340621 isoform X1 n=1 Tax=Convolutriloba macropyga TaxID=536237 RepID=UPI003F522106
MSSSSNSNLSAIPSSVSAGISDAIIQQQQLQQQILQQQMLKLQQQQQAQQLQQQLSNMNNPGNNQILSAQKQQQHQHAHQQPQQQSYAAPSVAVNNSSGGAANTNSASVPQYRLSSSTPQNKYGQLLAVIDDLGRDIRPSYAGSRSAQERLKKGIVLARSIVRECIIEAEMNAKNN